MVLKKSKRIHYRWVIISENLELKTPVLQKILKKNCCYKVPKKVLLTFLKEVYVLQMTKNLDLKIKVTHKYNDNKI